MPFGLRKRKRFDRVASLELPPGQWERAWISLSRRDVLGRIALALLAAAAICVVIHGWDPPFWYRTGYTPPRDIVATVAFTRADHVATQARSNRRRIQRDTCTYRIAEPLAQLRAKLRNTLVELTAAPTLDKLDPKICARSSSCRRPTGRTGRRPRNSRSSSERFAPPSRRKNRWIASRRPWPRLLPPLRSRDCWTSSATRTGRETSRKSSPIRRATPNCSRSSPSATC